MRFLISATLLLLTIFGSDLDYCSMKQEKEDDLFVKEILRRQVDKRNEDIRLFLKEDNKTRNSNFIKENKKVDSVTNSKCKQRNYLEKEKKPDWMFSNTTNRLFTPNSKLHQQPKKKRTANKKPLKKMPEEIEDDYKSTQPSDTDEYLVDVLKKLEQAEKEKTKAKSKSDLKLSRKL